MKPTACRVCDGHYVPTGILASDSLAAILSARWRVTLGDARDWICWQCQAWAAREARLIR